MADKSIKLDLRVWYDEKSRHIKLAGKGLTASTVSNDPASDRYHPNLYRKLAKALRDAGAPVPILERRDADTTRGRATPRRHDRQRIEREATGR